MTTRYLSPTAAILILATAVPLSADRVKLRSGKVIEGMFMGADSKSVRVLLDDGQVSEVPIADAVAVEFSARKPAHVTAAKAHSQTGRLRPLRLRRLRLPRKS